MCGYCLMCIRRLSGWAIQACSDAPGIILKLAQLLLVSLLMCKMLLYSFMAPAASERMFVTLSSSCTFGVEHVAACDKQYYVMLPCSHLASGTLHLCDVHISQYFLKCCCVGFLLMYTAWLCIQSTSSCQLQVRKAADKSCLFTCS